MHCKQRTLHHNYWNRLKDSLVMSVCMCVCYCAVQVCGRAGWHARAPRHLHIIYRHTVYNKNKTN